MTKSEMYDWVREQYRIATKGKYGNVPGKFYEELCTRLDEKAAHGEKFQWWWFGDAYAEIVDYRQTAA